MDESILNTIKKMLGLDADYEAFDTDIIVLINSVLMVLSQLGIGPDEGYSITGSYETWREVLGDRIDLDAVQTYVYLRVKTLFDPPASGTVMEAYENAIKELEWRLVIRAERMKT